MVTRVMLSRHGSWTGRIGQFRTARTALALSWHVLFRSSTSLGLVAAESRRQQRALRHRF